MLSQSEFSLILVLVGLVIAAIYALSKILRAYDEVTRENISILKRERIDIILKKELVKEFYDGSGKIDTETLNTTSKYAPDILIEKNEKSECIGFDNSFQTSSVLACIGYLNIHNYDHLYMVSSKENIDNITYGNKMSDYSHIDLVSYEEFLEKTESQINRNPSWRYRVYKKLGWV